MKKLKILLCLFTITIVTSCKKNDLVKEPTFDDMKVIMSKSPELNQVFKLDDEINIIRQTAFYKNLRNIKSGLRIMSTSVSNANKLKTESDLKQFLDLHCDNKGLEIIDKIKMQLQLVKKFGEIYPSFNQFSEDEKRELLSNSFIEYQKNISLSKKLLIAYNSELQIKVNGDCMGDFNISFNHCQNVYNIERIGIWALIIGSLGSGIGEACIAEGVAMWQLMDCQDEAADHLANC